MGGQLAQQARELLGHSDLVIMTERVDDVALRIGQMVTMGCVAVLDRASPPAREATAAPAQALAPADRAAAALSPRRRVNRAWLPSAPIACCA